MGGLETSSKRYAKALIGYGVEKDNLDILFSEFSSLIQTLEDSEDLVSFIQNPTISKDIKQKVLDELISDNLPNTSIVINLLSQNNRLDMLLDVCKGFIKQYNVHKDIVEVTVTTPIEISEDIEGSIQAYLNSIENGKIKLVKKKDETLIAGFTIDYNNTRLDASVKKRLEKMKKELKKNKLIMKKIILLFMTSYLFQSCIALKFPDKMEINISVPEDYDIEKLEILVDTLRSQAKDKFDMQVEIGTVKKKK